MKAAVIERQGGVENIVYRHWPDPGISPDEVLLKVEACALNYLDLEVRRGMPGMAVPMPFNIGASELNSKKLWQSSDSLSEELFTIRKHQAFRAVSTASVFKDNPGMLADNYTNTRLIGRSVWNSKWKLVIPGRSLLNDPDEGLDRFIQTVNDIQVHFHTYSYSGN